MVKTLVSSKGQTTIPVMFRKRWHASRVIWTSNPDGSASVRPAPDVMTLLGRAGSKPPRHPEERELAMDAIVAEHTAP